MSAQSFATETNGWSHFLHPRVPNKPLVGSHRAKWVVVGAGFTGLAAARRLAEIDPNEHILLIDARQLAQGASGRNSGYAVANSHFSGGFDTEKVPEYQRVNRINSAGLAMLRALVQANAIDCDWHENGFHHAAADTQSMAELANFKTYVEALEIDHDTLDRDALRAQLGTHTYFGAVHVKSGALVQPAALVRGLADNLPANVTLFENSPVLTIDKASPAKLKFSNGEIVADKVLLAVNYEAAKLGHLRHRLTASTLSGSFTRQLTDDEMATLGDLKQWGVLSLHSGGATVRLTADHRICLRNTAEFTHANLLDEATLRQRQATHREAFERRFPQLAHVPFEHAWSGVEGISRNGTNFFGELTKGIWFAGGYNGSGVSRGTAFGTAIADYAAGQNSTLVSDCLGSAPASWIPPRPLLDFGALWTVRKRFKGVGKDR